MRDSEVVAAIVAGDPAGLAAAYDKYAAPLYSYCRTLLREPADAADAVQDTFVIAASRLSALRDPERLRSWLYAVARNECHRRLRGGSDFAPLEEAPDVTDESVDISADAERRELNDLINAALGGVGPAEREVLELQLRQGLDGGEVAAVLGVTRNHAHALLSRARDQLHTSLGVLLVARSGRPDCPELDELLADWDGKLTVLLRKRLNRHIQHCPACSDRRRRELAPAMFLGLAPILALPALTAALPGALRERVLHAAGGATPPPHPVALTHGGFPRALNSPKQAWWHSRTVHVTVAAASAAGIAIAGTMIATPAHHGALPGSGVPAAVGSNGTAGSSAAAGRAGSRGTGGSRGAGATAGATAVQPGTAITGTHPAIGSSAGAATGAAGATTTATASAPASATATATSPADNGTLAVSPASIVLSPLLGGT
ncbi:MAG: sigma-70 family RNA polymerase sigma factor, partial [Streptosporangiaceae bacterium]